MATRPPNVLERIVLRSEAEVDRPAIAGPWLGELGVGMIKWAPYLRSVASGGAQVMCAGKLDHLPIYADFAHEYWVVPEECFGGIAEAEQVFNDGVLQNRWCRDEVEAELARKGLKIPDRLLEKMDHLVSATATHAGVTHGVLVTELGLAREFNGIRSGSDDIDRSAKMSKALGIDHWIMYLPRQRRVQDVARTWSAATCLGFIDALAPRLPDGVGIAVLGSQTYEGDLREAIDRRSQGLPVVNLIGTGFGLQVAFWGRALMGTGPPSGGLCPAYLLGIPLVHWEKPGRPALRKGLGWRETQEQHFSAATGVVSEWLMLDDSGSELDEVVRMICAKVDGAL